MFGQSYVANCSSVDGQAAFRDEDSDHRHIEYFQGLEKFREEGLPDRLPAHLEQKVLDDPQLCEVDEEIPAKQTTGGLGTLKRGRQRRTNLLKKLKLEALRQYQQNWVRERRDWKVLTRGRQVVQHSSKTDFVQDICLLIPERGRLAQQMRADHPLKPDDMWQALQDLHALCVQDFTVLYLPRSRPVDGACPVKCCQLQMERSVLRGIYMPLVRLLLKHISLPKSQRNHHIQSCVQWDMAHRLGYLKSDVHYCHQCFEWVIGRDWEKHCQSHLAKMTTKRCGTTTYCHTLVRPGYCPFCIRGSDPSTSACRRLESWTRDHKLWNHVEEHLSQSHWPRACPHPLCEKSFVNAEELRFHFVDEHGFSRARSVQVGKSTAPDPGEEGVKGKEDTRAARSSQKRKLSTATSNFEWVTPQSFDDTATTGQTQPTQRYTKRSRPTTTTIQPTEVILDREFSDAPSSPTMVALSPLSVSSSQAATNRVHARSDSEAGLSPFHKASIEDETHCFEPEHCEQDSDFVTMFDQYIRSPSPPASPDDQTSSVCEMPLTHGIHDHHGGQSELSRNSGALLSDETVSTQEIKSNTAKIPSIRLLVREPKVILSIKIPQNAKGRSTKGQRDCAKGSRRVEVKRGARRSVRRRK